MLLSGNAAKTFVREFTALKQSQRKQWNVNSKLASAINIENIRGNDKISGDMD